MRANPRGPLAATAILALAAALTLGPAAPTSKSPASPPDTTLKKSTDRKYPANRAAELKARLLERPKDPGAASWALEYAATEDVARFEPATRAAERAWAARVGLAAKPSADEKKSLQALVEGMGDCPLDSVAIKRAAQGLARIGVVVPVTGKYERFGRTFVNGFRIALDEHNREWSPQLRMILHDSEGDPLVGARKSRWLLKDHGVSVP